MMMCSVCSFSGSSCFTFHCTDLNQRECAVKALQKRAKDYVKTVTLGPLLRLEHKNVVALKEVFESDTHIFMVSKFVDGKPLFQYLASLDVLSEDLMATAIRQIVDALVYLHYFDIIHRDLKPSNLLLTKEGDNLNVQVSDAAFSTVIGSDMELELVNGDYTYTAPEIFLSHDYGAPVDLWALGVILFIMACGEEPFKRDNDMDAFRAIQRADYAFDAPGWKDISMHCHDLIRRLLAVDPAIRFTALQASRHKWVTGEETKSVILPQLPQRLQNFNQRCAERVNDRLEEELRVRGDCGVALRHRDDDLEVPRSL
ncbi:unnamed protein product [Mesocestoides corti]|uniref:Protein kinase domain-containing protein n=1 Tax=Mesocestoides corti TaxID=53468 RepID=A0A0R3U468_MESCO|nr:unnamed protein product [Mesocestoides corti]